LIGLTFKYIGRSDVTKFESISVDHAVRQVYTYCNRKIVRSNIANCQTLTGNDCNFKLLSIELNVITGLREQSGRTIQVPCKMASTTWS